MKLLTQKVKERVNQMFKRKPNNNINVIYKSSEETRRAIDDLYTQKSGRNKTVAATAFISLAIGVALGIYMQMSVMSSHVADSVVKIEVAEQLKATPQSAEK